MTEDAIALLIEPRERPVGNGIVHRLLPWRNRRMVGPFIFADHMGPTPAGERNQTRRLHGLQSWIALPTETEDGATWFEHHGAAAITTRGCRCRAERASRIVQRKPATT